MTRPGARLRLVAQRIFDRHAMERLVDPAIADLQYEHAEAIGSGQVWHSRWIRFTAYIAFSQIAVVALSRASARAVRDWGSADDRALGRSALFSCIAALVLTLVFVWPPVWKYLPHRGHRLAIVWWLLPQSMSVALPMGVPFGVLCGLRGRVATKRVQRGIVWLASLCSLAMIVNLGWILPASNQAFRELVAGGHVLRGLNELTLRELASTDLAQIRRLITAESTSRFAFAFHSRLALAFAPLVLALFSLGVVTARRSAYGRFALGFAALTSPFAYYALLYGARAEFNGGWFLPVVAGWGPNLVFLLMTLFLFHRPLVAETQESAQ